MLSNLQEDTSTSRPSTVHEQDHDEHAVSTPAYRVLELLKHISGDGYSRITRT